MLTLRRSATIRDLGTLDQVATVPCRSTLEVRTFTFLTLPTFRNQGKGCGWPQMAKLVQNLMKIDL